MAAKKARVLVDFSDGERIYKCNDIVSFDDDQLRSHKAAGHIDDSPPAVAYVEKQAAKAKALAEAAAAG